MTSPASNRPVPPRRRIPRSFKDLTPSKHFNPRTFFQELVWKGWFTPRHGESRRPVFPRLKRGQVAITWIGHASFLIQFTDLNVLVDPNFANWLFLLKRIKRAGLKIRDLPPIAVMNVQGRTFMQPPLDNPFTLALDEAKWLRQHTPIIFVDFHAEATSEKIAFARMLDGQVSAVVGTHTHVQTADEQIFPGGTAYLTDAGFTGPHESVLGREIVPVVTRFRTAVPQRFEVARNDVKLQGAVIEIDNASGNAVKIQRVSENLI